ncbi:MAG TPA: DUF309 domain-containing protein [Actinomycetota bacterium]|jgi:predicted metal-dependent hydrolase|nr:DUF309 domain-containing protein [Actinomycetota bacterium]
MVWKDDDVSDTAMPPPQKRARPRDELGRPLPWGSENRLDLEDFDALPTDENHRLAIAHFNAGRFFPAHEAWETAWKQSKGTPDEEFFKGLSQLGAGYTHYARGNPHGTHTLIRRGTGRIRGFGPLHHGVDVEVLVREAEEHAHLAEEVEGTGRPMPSFDHPRI